MPVIIFSIILGNLGDEGEVREVDEAEPLGEENWMLKMFSDVEPSAT